MVVKKIAYTAMLSGVSLVSFAMGSTAWAQDSAEAEVSEEDTNEIIVTATKREQTLEETPISVSVTSADVIEKASIRDISDLQTVAPSLRVTQLQSSANTNFTIRGFGNGANNPGIEPSVGVFIDGVYRSRSAAQIGDLPNLQRVEVLRGPQSTLFGKNASAGVISVITRAPQYDFGGSVEGSYGNYNAIVVKGDLTGPIVADKVAFSIAGNYNKRDGYATNLTDDSELNERNRYGVRGQLLIEPSSDFKIRLIADYDKIDENCCIAANVVNGPTGAIIQALTQNQGLVPQDPYSYEVYNNLDSSNKIKNWGFSGQIDYDLGNLGLTSITAYRGVDVSTNQDSDFSGADLLSRNSADQKIRTFTQELRLTSDFDGPLNFLIGGYYFDEAIERDGSLYYGTQFRPFANELIRAATRGTQTVASLETALAPFGATSGAFFRSGDGIDEAFTLDNTAWSLFGSVDFELTERLKLSAGANYTKDKKDFTAQKTTTDVFSTIDFVRVGVAQGLAAAGVNPGNAAAVQAFAQANPAAFQAIQAGAANPAVNTLLGLRPLQFLPPFLNVPNPAEDGRTRDSDLSYTIRAAYELSDSVNAYVSYGTGFKASSINLSGDSRPSAAALAAAQAGGYSVPNLNAGSRFADPEEAEVYEIGLKGKWDQVAFNIALFDQTLKGFQSNIFVGTGFALANAGQQSVRGFEFDGSVSPVKPLTLTAAVTYLDPVYDSFVNTGLPVPGQPTPAQGGPQLDLTGEIPSGIPELTFQTSATYVHDFGNDSSLTLRADYSYESKVRIADNVPANITREQNNMNGSITYAMANGFQLSAWARNILKDKYLLSAFPSVAQGGSFSGYPNVPRTYGITGRFKF